MNPNQPDLNQPNTNQAPQPVVNTPSVPQNSPTMSNPAQPQQPSVTPLPPTSNGIGKLPLILMVVALLLILGAGGYYLYMNNLQNTTSQPTANPVEDLGKMENELNTLQPESSDSGFENVDEDLNKL